MGKKIATLKDDQLTTWKNIRRDIWFFENVTMNSDQITPKDALSSYDLLNKFLEGCIREYDIDETRPFTISDVTGLIYYLEDDGSN